MEKIVISESAKAKARDFIDNEKQFQLGFLPTEQSNPITATLEEDFKRSTLAGVQCLQRGDRQIAITMRHVFASPEFKSLVDSMVSTITTPNSSTPNSPTPSLLHSQTSPDNLLRLRRDGTAFHSP